MSSKNNLSNTDSDPRIDPSRRIKAPTGNQLNAKSWLTEAPLCLIQGLMM
jgi:urocanate hydratase